MVQTCFKGRREQHNEGWESWGEGAQKYGRRENVVREAGDPPVPPPPPLGVDTREKLNKYITIIGLNGLI